MTFIPICFLYTLIANVGSLYSDSRIGLQAKTQEDGKTNDEESDEFAFEESAGAGWYNIASTCCVPQMHRI